MKKLIVITAVGMCLCGSAESQRVVCDGNSCKIEPAGQGKTGYTVVSPVGRASIKPIEQAPRLKTLAGKTIAVVGHNFMALAVRRCTRWPPPSRPWPTLSRRS